MKFSRIVSLALTLTIATLCLLSPQSSFAQESSASVLSVTTADEPVIADENDFTYIATPKKNPKWALVTKYTGTDSKIIIPDTLGGYPVQVLSSEVFKECNDLTYIRIPASVTSVSGQTFAECRNLLEIDIDPKNEYYVVENGILYNSDKTTLIAFPNGIGGEFTIPESVINIGSYAFSGAYKLTKVNMYNTVTAISQSAFQGCFSLNEIRLSDNLAVLGKKALANCVELRDLHLPASLSIIAEDAILGDMGSKNDKFYYFTDGVYCVPGSVAYKYVYDLGVRSPYLKTETRTLTDIETGVQIIDTEGTLPLDKTLYFDVTPVLTEEVASLVPVRYNRIEAYDISLSCDEQEYIPTEKLIIQFSGLPDDTVISSAKIYRTNGTRVFELIRSPHTPFVVAQSKTLGRYIVITNNDFSKKGDVDGDGIITSYDARFALCLAAGLVLDAHEEQIETADVNNQNGVTTEDSRNILRYAAGIIDSF